MPCRDLPERFGDGVQVHRRFSRWAESGVWERVFQHLATDADNEYAMIDSTIVSRRRVLAPRRSRSDGGLHRSHLEESVCTRRINLTVQTYDPTCDLALL
jgi:transposase